MIFAIAFGPKFLEKVYPDAKANGVEPFDFKKRKGKTSTMPSTGEPFHIYGFKGKHPCLKRQVYIINRFSVIAGFVSEVSGT